MLILLTLITFRKATIGTHNAKLFHGDISQYGNKIGRDSCSIKMEDGKHLTQ